MIRWQGVGYKTWLKAYDAGFKVGEETGTLPLDNPTPYENIVMNAGFRLGQVQGCKKYWSGSAQE